MQKVIKNRYQISQTIGIGGMATVYLASKCSKPVPVFIDNNAASTAVHPKPSSEYNKTQVSRRSTNQFPAYRTPTPHPNNMQYNPSHSSSRKPLFIILSVALSLILITAVALGISHNYKSNSSSDPISLSLSNNIKNLFSIPDASADTGFTFQKNIPLVDKIVTISKEGHSFNVDVSGNLKIQTTASVSSAPSNKKVNVGDTVPLEVSPKFNPVNFTLNLAFNLNGNTIKKTVSAVMSSPFQKTLSFDPVVVSGGGLLNPTITLKPKIIFSKSIASFALEQTGNASLDKNILTFPSSSPQTVNVSINKIGSSEVLLTSPNLKFSFDRISLAGNASITVLNKKIPISLPDISVPLSGSTAVSGTPQQISLAQFSTNFVPSHSTSKPGQNLPSRLPFSKSNLLWILLSLIAGGTVILLVALLTANKSTPDAAISKNSASRIQRLPYTTSAYLLTNGKNVPLFAARPLITIGRSQANTIPLKDSYASNRHAQIIFQKGVWYIKDIGSRNGVYVNNKKINKITPLHHGDSIKIGHTVFKFVQNLSNKYSHRPHSERRT